MASLPTGSVTRLQRTSKKWLASKTDFAAIAFETANEQPCSVCSVGIVVVRGGAIVDSYYSLIHPEPEYYQWFCQQVHGLSAEACAYIALKLL